MSRAQGSRLRQGRSLRLTLMLWLAIPVALVLSASVWLSYRTARDEAMRIMNRNLTASARMIAEQVRYREGQIGVVVPPAALEIFATDAHDEVAYAVHGPDGTLIAGFPDLDPPTLNPAATGPQEFDTVFRTKPMHAVELYQPVIASGGTVTVQVAVGETLRARDALVRTLWLRGFAEQAALVLCAAASIWFGITQELRPLMRLRREVLDRPATSVESFDETMVQTELRPLVTALNAHMARLGVYLTRQQRFLDGAAHQLRTALAILKSQVGVARQDKSAARAKEALARFDSGLSEITRVTNQLLLLGRVEHERARLVREPVDLRLVVRGVVGDIAPRALDAGVELVLEAEESCRVAGNALLLRECVLNLVDNAIHHAGRGAVATITLGAEAGMGVLTVADTGVGLGPAGRAGLLHRFAGAGTSSGTGLGLTIVAEIVEMFGGRLDLPDPPGGRGFVARVSLPLAEA